MRADAKWRGTREFLYGLTCEEFAYILDTFPIVRRKGEAKYGEYRTKRLVLERIGVKVALRSGWIARSSRQATDLTISRERQCHFCPNALEQSELLASLPFV